jgi:hypothetical protein
MKVQFFVMTKALRRAKLSYKTPYRTKHTAAPKLNFGRDRKAL